MALDAIALRIGRGVLMGGAGFIIPRIPDIIFPRSLRTQKYRNEDSISSFVFNKRKTVRVFLDGLAYRHETLRSIGLFLQNNLGLIGLVSPVLMEANPFGVMCDFFVIGIYGFITLDLCLRYYGWPNGLKSLFDDFSRDKDSLIQWLLKK